MKMNGYITDGAPASLMTNALEQSMVGSIRDMSNVRSDQVKANIV